MSLLLFQNKREADYQLNTLVREGLVTDYPPLVDPEPGAMTAQYVRLAHSNSGDDADRTGAHNPDSTNL
jgi:hypothetical protein